MGGLWPPIFLTMHRLFMQFDLRPNPMLESRPRWRHSLIGVTIFVGCLAIGTPASIHAQPILPALRDATSIEAAFQAVGAGKPTISGYLQVEFAEISLAGPLRITASSQIPGTSSLVLMAGAPMGWRSGVEPGATGAAGRAVGAAPVSPQTTRQKPTPVLLKAWQVPAGQRAEMTFVLPRLDKWQVFTLLAYAQGRWQIAVREVKLARRPGSAASSAVETR